MRFLAKSAIGCGLLALLGAGATLFAQATEATSPYEAQIASVKAAMLEDERAVLSMKATATTDNDIIKVNCVNDYLVQMRPQMNMVDSAISNLRAADSSDQASAYAAVQSEAAKVSALRQSASQCVDSKQVIDESLSTYSVSDGVPNPWDDQVDTTGEPTIEAPAYASPDR